METGVKKLVKFCLLYENIMPVRACVRNLDLRVQLLCESFKEGIEGGVSD